VQLLEDEDHDVTDFHKALAKAYLWGEEIPIGLFWRRTDLETLEEQEPVLDEGGPLGFRELGLTKEQSDELIQEML
jgi:2-oxoglutarate ferredoxin oxidoreductase subunit beta